MAKTHKDYVVVKTYLDTKTAMILGEMLDKDHGNASRFLRDLIYKEALRRGIEI